MNPQARQTLKEVVTKFGPELGKDPVKCESLLKDFIGSSRREIYVLVSCIREGAVRELQSNTGGATVQMSCARLSKKLQQNLALSEAAANWAVESWAIALGLMDEPVPMAGRPRPSGATGRIPNVSAPSGTPPPGASATNAPTAFTSPISAAAINERRNSGALQLPLVQPASATRSAMRNAIKPDTVPLPATLDRTAPDTRTPPPDWDQPTHILTVAEDGSGDFKTLKEAMRSALPNARLMLRPGTYRESLVVSRSVQIMGEGDPQEIILEFVTAPCISLVAGYMKVIAITVRGKGGTEHKSFPAVDISKGQLIFEDCDLTCDSQAIISVHGAGAETLVRNCQIHDGKSGGISFTDGASGSVADCQIYNNGMSNIQIGNGCSPLIQRCQISSATIAGIYVNEGGRGLIEDCDIWNNAITGIQVRRGGNPSIRRCRISSGERSGILVGEQGAGAFEECEIFDNGRAGVKVAQASTPTFTKCRIYEGKGEGVEIAEKGAGTFVDCEIFGNQEAGVHVKDAGTPTFTRCHIRDGQTEGIKVSAGGLGRFIGCDISANLGPGLRVIERSNPVLEQCAFHNGMEAGALINASRVTMTLCEFVGHSGTALIFTARADGKIDRCHIVRNLGNAVMSDDGAQPLFAECKITNNGGNGFVVTKTSQPKLNGCVVSRNTGHGIEIGHQGQGRIEHCTISENGGSGISVADGGRPTVRDCHVEKSGGAGILLRRSGVGSFESCLIEGGQAAGVEIEAGGNPILRACRITANAGPGILVHPNGGGNLERLEVGENAGADWEVSPSARVTRVGC